MPDKSQHSPDQSSASKILQSRQISTQIVKQYSGPVPSPEILAKFEEIVPGAAAKLVQLALTEAEHRHNIEKKQLDANIEFTREYFKDTKRGMAIALITTTLVLAIIVLALFLKQSIVAGIMGGSTIVALATVFVVGRRDSIVPTKEKDKS